MLVNDSHSSCLKSLGEAHIREHYQICWNFKPHTKKDRKARLRAVLMEVTLSLVLEPSQSDLAPSTSASVQNAPPALHMSCHCSPSLMPRKRHKKQRSNWGWSLVLRQDKRGVQWNAIHVGPFLHPSTLVALSIPSRLQE